MKSTPQGLVGSGVLDAMIKMKDVTKISILSRRPVAMAEAARDPRINVIIHKDFTKYDSEVLEKLKGARGCVWACKHHLCFCCLFSTGLSSDRDLCALSIRDKGSLILNMIVGCSQTQVSKDEYLKITKDYAEAASKAFEHLSPEQEKAPFNFVYVSGNGATTEPTRFSALFARTKGAAELALASIRAQNPLMHTISVRPAMVDAHGHDAIKDFIPKPPFVYRLAGPLISFPIRHGLPSFNSPTLELGRFLTEMAMGKHSVTSPAPDIAMIGEFPIYENTAFRRIVGLS
ncbi:putative nucleoside-diphosphate-sugar epimerase [Xylaria sp. CBS 124048]|nr:putative nucleoside-diphosphate-sugar epimerase [Xylaria sp. CBS 124048]